MNDAELEALEREIEALEREQEALAANYAEHIRTTDYRTCDGTCCYGDWRREFCCKEGYERLACVHRRQWHHDPETPHHPVLIVAWGKS
jgi:hypothetical protein